MDKILSVCLTDKDYQHNQAYTYLQLPATPCELVDALDKLNLTSPEDAAIEIEQYYGFGCLSSAPIEDAGLIQLNTLTEQLSKLDSEQIVAFCGLVKMENSSSATPIPFSHLMDYAHHTQDCLVLADVHSDYELGKFYCDNGFIEAVNDVPDEAYKLLDFGKIGTEMRAAEDGVYEMGCYVFQTEDIPHADWTYGQWEPDYTVQIEIENMNTGEKTQLRFPANEEELQSSLDRIHADRWDLAILTCTDCIVPQLREAVTQADDPELTNQFARTLSQLSKPDLTKYKALIDAMDCSDLHYAAELLEELDDYVMDRHIHSFEEIAMDHLRVMVEPSDLEVLKKHINLYAYGDELLEQSPGVMTDYGYFQRRDGEMFFAPQEEVKQTDIEFQSF